MDSHICLLLIIYTFVYEPKYWRYFSQEKYTLGFEPTIPCLEKSSLDPMYRTTNPQIAWTIEQNFESGKICIYKGLFHVFDSPSDEFK